VHWQLQVTRKLDMGVDVKVDVPRLGTDMGAGAGAGGLLPLLNVGWILGVVATGTNVVLTVNVLDDVGTNAWFSHVYCALL
jgi:hypothetical protein